MVHSTTKYMDGHATQVGGCVVDSGNFDWDAHAGKFPGLTTPDESYHGLTYTKAFGKMAYMTKARSTTHARPRFDTVAAKRIPAQPRTRNAPPARAKALRERTESGRIPKRRPTCGMDTLLRTERRRGLRTWAKVSAKRLLWRYGLRTEGRPRHSREVHGLTGSSCTSPHTWPTHARVCSIRPAIRTAS